ncbi:hypothetical protein LJC48_01360 [Desulfovibrio sp. OttesenSCG-928-C06]|nr:hypothetical protein [Desulfovibrio sp. OttesenSCG-928-C06]
MLDIRVCTSLVFCRHPIFAGLLWWLFGGSPEIAIPAAIFFELIWLDSFYVGTYVPPLALLPYLVFLPLTAIFNLTTPQQSVLLLVLCLPLASLGARVENRLRKYQGGDYHKLQEAVAGSGDIAAVLGRSVRNALLRQSLVFGCLYLVSAMVIFGIVWLFGVRLQLWPTGAPLPEGLWGMPAGPVQWGMLWTVAAVGGLLALRIRWAQGTFVAGVVALAALWML